MEHLFREARYAVRRFAASPGFTVTALLSLALGIGAAALVFSVVDAVLLRPLPYYQSERLVSLWTTSPKGPAKQRVSYPDLADWKAQNRTIEALVGWGNYEVVFTGMGEPERLQAALTMGDLFHLLGVPPLLGSSVPAVNAGAQAPAVVISHGLWTRSFNSDPAAVGRLMTLSGQTYLVAGVMPAGFRFPFRAGTPVDLWIPLRTFNPALEKRRDARLIEVVGRLRPQASFRQAQAEMDVIASRLSREYPSTNRDVGVRVVRALDDVTGDVSRGVWILSAAVGALLLIACVNVVNLLMARTAGRRQETAVRVALGGSRARIALQFLVESLLLSAGGGILGCLLALWGVHALRGFVPADLPRAEQIGVDSHVLGFALVAAVAAGVILGSAAAWHAVSMASPTANLRQAGLTSSESQAGKRLTGGLVVLEMALAMILLTGAALFMNSLWRLLQSDPGFDPHNVLTFGVNWPDQKYRNTADAFRELQSRILAIPGVIAVSTGLQLPDRGAPMLSDVAPFVEIEGRSTPPADRARASVLRTQPGYFRAMGIGVGRGRDFNDGDTAGASRVAIVNESLARLYFHGENPLGRRVVLSSWTLFGQRAQEIIGVAQDVKYSGMDIATPVVYVPFAQAPRQGSHVVVKTAGDPLTFVNAVRAALRSFDKDQPIEDIQTLDRRIAESIARDRFNALLLALFSALAVSLAAVGLYGVLSYATTQRTREVAIRLALGAERADVLRLVLGQGMSLALAGMIVGMAGALALTRIAKGLLFGVTPYDPPTIVAATLVLLLVAAFACWIPARRAMKTDAVMALRSQ